MFGAFDLEFLWSLDVGAWRFYFSNSSAICTALAERSGKALLGPDNQLLKTNVTMDCDGMRAFTALLWVQTRKKVSLFPTLRMTTATLPSGFRKAVVSKSSSFDEAIILFAPGLINREKWPKT